MDSLSVVKIVFDRLEADPDLSPDRPLEWRYYFSDPIPEKLEPLRDELVRQGFHYVNLFLHIENEGTDEEEDIFILYVRKLEQHTVDSFDQRCREFEALAQQFGIRGFDHFDVGLPTPPVGD